MTAVIQLCPAVADAELTARNLATRAGSADPTAIAEFLGLGVFMVEPIATMHAPGARRPGAIWISNATPEKDVDGVIAELLGLAAVDRYGLAPGDRYAFAKRFAACLRAERESASAYWLAARRR